MDLRSWCSTCAEVVDGESTAFAGAHRGHTMKPIGATASIEVVVTDRRLDFDVGRYGFRNNVGIERGRTPAQQEAYTRKRIEEMRKRVVQRRRSSKLQLQGSHDTKVCAAFPSALLFGMRKQYGMNYLERAEEVAKREGLWFGD